MEEKSNEITAVPELLDLVEVRGSSVMADAMNCQKEIARKIQEKKTDYILGLKGNQPTLLENARLYFETFGCEQLVARRRRITVGLSIGNFDWRRN